MQQNLADKARSATAAGQPAQYDQQQVLGQANQIAEQLLQQDPGSRRSQLHSLQMDDAVMYAVVVQALEQIQTDQQAQAKAMVAGGGPGGPGGGGGGGAPGGPGGPGGKM